MSARGYLSNRRAVTRDDPDNALEHGPDILGAVAKPCYLLPRKRKATPSTQRSVPKSKLEAFQNAWDPFESNARSCLKELRSKQVNKVFHALEAVHGEEDVANPADMKEERMLAVMLIMGTGGVGGDRSDVFGSFVQSVVTDLDKTETVKLVAEKCRSMVSTLRSLFGTEESTGIDETDKDTHLLVGIEDADLFVGDILRDLVYICNSRVKSGHYKSISFVFGLSTSDGPVYSALGVREASMISPMTVIMPTPDETFEALISSMCLPCDQALLLSQRAFQILKTEFFNSDCTSSFFFRFMRHAYAQQLWTHPLLYCFFSTKITNFRVLNDQWDHLTQMVFDEEQLDYVRRLPSFVSQIKGLRDDEMVRKFLAGDFQEIISWRISMGEIQSILTTAYNSYGAQACSTWKSELFLAMCDLKVPLVKSKIVAALFAKIQKSYRNQLKRLLEEVATFIAGLTCIPSGVASEVDELLEDLDAEGENIDQLEDVEAAPKKKRQMMAKGGGAAKQKRAQLLRENLERSRRMDPLQPLRTGVIDVLTQILSQVKPLGEMPMYEMFYFDLENFETLQNADGGMSAVAQPRASFWNAMRHSRSYLGSGASTPDSAVAYTLLAEGGRLVNLYDWYQSFSAVKSVTSQGQEQIEEECETQARFAKACAELEFVGVFKKTKRKTDHVMRLLYEQ